ncbi:MAG: HD domain-containing protein [Dehalococcoidia bacterium]|nr:HD domain-containing protein [Dehalococcoidia bacterium]
MTHHLALSQVEAELLRLPRGLYEHVVRTRALARKLAPALGADLARVEVAAAGHDLARALGAEALLAEARRLGIEPSDVEEAAPILLHGAIAAERLRREMCVTDAEVLEAVRWHTTGRADMGLVAQAVFLADKLEPDKVARRPSLRAIAPMVAKDPARAIAAFLTDELAAQIKRGALLHPAAVETRNFFLLGSRVRR